jgi:hypothetical protein
MVTLDSLLAVYDLRTFDPNASDSFLSFRICGDCLSCSRITRYGVAGKRERGKRSVISEFSANSRSRMEHQLRAAQFSFRVKRFLTFTYPLQYPFDGREFKLHWKRFLDACERKFRNIRIFWFLEFQKRGAPHFHAYVDKTIDYDLLASLWRQATDGAGGFVYITDWTGRKKSWLYARKYGSKEEQKTVPSYIENVGRFWGWRNKPELLDARLVIRFDDRLDVLQQYVEFLLSHLHSGRDFFCSLGIEFVDVYSCSAHSEKISRKLKKSFEIIFEFLEKFRKKPDKPEKAVTFFSSLIGSYIDNTVDRRWSINR